MKMKRLVGIVLALAMVVTCMAGCGKKNKVGTLPETQMPAGEVTYPLQVPEEENQVLTVWCPMPPSITTDVTTLGETAFAKNLEEKTGIKVEWQHPSGGSSSEQLQLMLASGELPDIIMTGWLSMGPEEYIENMQIYALNDLMDAGYTPNLKKYIESNPEIDKMIKTDKGQYYGFPFVRGDNKLLGSTGFMLRGDWLEEFGLEVPDTIADWDEVLAAFKTKCETPLAMIPFDQFSSGFDAYNNMYIKDGKVVYGPIEKNFKAFVTKLNEWYNKGYIDKNYAIADTAAINSAILNDKAGVTFGSGGGTMGSYITAKKGTSFNIVGAPFPGPAEGVPAKFGSKELPYGMGAAVITTSCKNPYLAARFLDYGYGEEGHMVYNFGKEGESYNMVDGYPTYVDDIKNNAEGKTMARMLAHNCLAGHWGPFVQDVRYIEQYYNTPAQNEALARWTECEMEKYKVPQVIMTTDESDEYSAIMGQVNTYMEETYNAFIVGKTPISEFDNFVAKIKELGIDRAIEIRQAAYDRYLNR